MRAVHLGFAAVFAVALTICLLRPSASAVGQNQTPLKVEYDRLKSLEGRIPLPAPSAQFDAGTYSSFRGRMLPKNSDQIPPSSPSRTINARVNAVNVTLVFSTDT